MGKTEPEIEQVELTGNVLEDLKKINQLENNGFERFDTKLWQNPDGTTTTKLYYKKILE